MKKPTADYPPQPGDADNFPHLRDSIRRFAQQMGMSQDEAICHALSIGLREVENEATGTAEKMGDLSARQRAVLKALRKGCAVKEVADELKISEVTVRTHIQRIRTRLGCSDLLKLRMM